MTDRDFLALQEDLVGRYALEREIGRGGMGIVYLARDIRLDRPVALKLLPPDLAARPELRERFLREARTAARLSQPNIVPIHAVEEVGDHVFFVMTFVDGETLGRHVRERGSLPPHEAARILREVSWALAYAHAQGVVHRDVKPDNILIEAGTGRALVTDFGIAMVSEGGSLTGAGEMLGTAEYMSPEQASGEDVDGRSDLYSLGVVGYFMLSGTLPFEASTVAATLAKHLTQPAPPLSSAAQDVPRELAAVVDRCLAKAPEDRFTDAEALAEAVSGAIQERPEIPVPLRVFVTHNRERFKGLPGWLLFSTYMTVAGTLFLMEGAWIPGLATLLFGLASSAAPLLTLAAMARRLIQSGYSREDMLLAFEDDLARRREELAFELGGRRTWIDRLSQVMVYGGMLALVAGITLAVAVEEGALSEAFASFGLWLAAGGFLSSMGAMPLALTRLGGAPKLVGRYWPKFWKSRFGAWLFDVSGLGVKRIASASTAYRPTEMAIGLAADRLFGELPRDVQKSLPELPAVLRTLEADAERMRARVKELDRLIGEVERDAALARTSESAPDMSAEQGKLVGDLRATRDAAQERLGEVLRALETIRLELLRMHAGAGSVESMTADLSAARDLSADVGRLLEGRREVEGLLE